MQYEKRTTTVAIMTTNATATAAFPFSDWCCWLGKRHGRTFCL